MHVVDGAGVDGVEVHGAEVHGFPVQGATVVAVRGAIARLSVVTACPVRAASVLPFCWEQCMEPRVTE